MHAKQLVRLGALFAGWCLLVGLEPVNAQQAPPTEQKGVKVEVLTTIDLGPEIEGMQGRQLRLRRVTLEPGGVFAVHSHKELPAVVHVLQGTITEHREGGGGKEYKEGESWSEGKQTTHWAENKGAKPLVVIVADIAKP